MKKVFLTAALSLLFFSKIFPQWTQQTSGVNNPLNSIFFIDETTGWAYGDQGAILQTTNGGVNWTKQATGIRNRIFSLFFFNLNLGWGSGDRGKIIKYLVPPAMTGIIFAFYSQFINK